jgi:hypothetical protein
VCDYADVVFHVVRDLQYSRTGVRSEVVDSLAELALPGSILAWRLIRWLDRRRSGDLDLVSPTCVRELALQVDPATACASLIKAVHNLNIRGVPR